MAFQILNIKAVNKRIIRDYRVEKNVERLREVVVGEQKTRLNNNNAMNDELDKPFWIRPGPVLDHFVSFLVNLSKNEFSGRVRPK